MTGFMSWFTSLRECLTYGTQSLHNGMNDRNEVGG